MGCTGSMRVGNVPSTVSPSVCSMVTGSPATPSIGCRMTKPVRLVRNPVGVSPVPWKVSVPSGRPSMVAS